MPGTEALQEARHRPMDAEEVVSWVQFRDRVSGIPNGACCGGGHPVVRKGPPMSGLRSDEADRPRCPWPANYTRKEAEAEKDHMMHSARRWELPHAAVTWPEGANASPDAPGVLDPT
mmetsp:Transcript_121364/g.259117  ORF Transcript_121364/g.259117 Transcript_121364/m.259117 type:complete len:117 (-) Transcript_121364:64-414(-)